MIFLLCGCLWFAPPYLILFTLSATVHCPHNSPLWTLMPSSSKRVSGFCEHSDLLLPQPLSFSVCDYQSVWSIHAITDLGPCRTIFSPSIWFKLLDLLTQRIGFVLHDSALAPICTLPLTSSSSPISVPVLRVIHSGMRRGRSLLMFCLSSVMLCFMHVAHLMWQEPICGHLCFHKWSSFFMLYMFLSIIIIMLCYSIGNHYLH